MKGEISSTGDGRDAGGVGVRAADAADPAGTACWSPAVMVERLGGDEALARQLVTLFFGEYPRLLASLRASLETQDPEAIRRAAHAAKGCIANFVESGPQTTACEIERYAARGEMADLPLLAARLEREVATLVRAMTAFEQGAPCAS